MRQQLEEANQLNATLSAKGTCAVAEQRALEDRINGLGAQIHADSMRMAEMELALEAQTRRADAAVAEAAAAEERAVLMATAAAAKKPAAQRGRSPAGRSLTQRSRSPVEHGRPPSDRGHSHAGFGNEIPSGRSGRARIQASHGNDRF